MTNIEEVAKNIFLLDHNLYSIPRLGGIYLLNEEKKALIDSGPTTSAGAVLDGIKRLVRLEDIDYIVVTHVHLDHGGGTGFLLKYLPRAQVVAHHKGAKHLVDPSKLVHALFEAQYHDFLEKNGEAVPVPAARVRSVHEGDVIELSDKQVLRFIEAPGHASHQLAIHESRNNGIFIGDSVGIRIDGNIPVLVPVTPPGFDLELCISTLEKLMRLNASAIYYAHFGMSSRVQQDLQTSKARMESWYDLVSGAAKDGKIELVEKILTAKIRADLEPIREMHTIYEHMNEVIIPLNIAGYFMYYLEKRKAQGEAR